MRVLIIGGTGTISAHTAAFHIAAGDEVTLFHRNGAKAGATNARVIEGDRDDRQALLDAINAVRPDVLIDFACFRPEQAEALASCAAGKVAHLLFVSSVDALGFPLSSLPAGEDATRRPGVGAYALAKQACEDLLLDQHNNARIALTIVRPTYSMGERFVIGIFDADASSTFTAMRRGLPIVLPDDGALRIHPSSALDTGRMIGTIARGTEGKGKSYTVGTKGTAMSQRQYIELLGEVAGTVPSFVFVPIEAIARLQLPQLAEGLWANVTRFDLDFSFDLFSAEFPDFTWQAQLKDPISAYLARIDANPSPDSPARVDDVILKRLAC